MRFSNSLRRRWRSLREKEANNLALREELQFHLDRQTEENIANGMSFDQARKGAMATFGSLALVTEQTYHARGVAWLDNLQHDVRYGLRGLQRNLSATVTIVLLLSFGLGAATLLFTCINRLLLRPFQVSHPETLVRAAIKWPSVIGRISFPYASYQSLRHMRSLRDLAAVGDFDTTITSGGSSELAVANMVSGNYFQMLGVTPQVGRVLGPADEQPGGAAVVISHKLWMSQFGGSNAVAGSVISLEGQPFSIVGVMPRDFVGTSLDSSPDVWLPFAAQPLLSRLSLSDPHPDRYFSLIGRLQESVSRKQAEAEFDAAYQTREQADKETNPGSAILEPITQAAFALHDSFQSALSLLSWGLAAFLAMIGANVAGLLLALSMRHERDTALRVALGASRMRVAAHAIIRSLILGLAGATGGLLLSYAFAPLLKRLLPVELATVPLSPGFVACCLAVALAVGVSLAFGAVPAWVASRVAPEHALRRGTSTRRAGSLGKSLLVMQIGLTFILLVGSGLLIRTYYVLRDTNPGFEVEHLAEFTLNARVIGASEKLPPTLPFALQERVQNIPGVRSASLSSGALMRRIGLKTYVALPGQRVAKQGFLNATMNRVSSSYFDTLHIPIVAGRVFTPAELRETDLDSPPGPPISVVVNQAFARRFFPNENAIGKTFGHARPGQVATANYVVVGISGDSKYRSLREQMLPIFYPPLVPSLNSSSYHLLYVSTQASPASVIGAVKRALFALDPRLPFADVVTMHNRVRDSLWQERSLAILSLVFALISVLMAVIGLHGLLSYDTTQRTREFGIRGALGAQKLDVAMMLVRELARILAFGIAIGALVCLLASRVIASLLYGVRALDPACVGVALAIVACTVVAASWQPLQRGMDLDPAIVLREE
jgi:predicted permease